MIFEIFKVVNFLLDKVKKMYVKFQSKVLMFPSIILILQFYYVA